MSDVNVGNISDVDGGVNIAGRDVIVNNIQTIYERALTPAEILGKDLQIEVGLLAEGLRDYLKGLKEQVLNAGKLIAFKELESYTLAESQVFFGRKQSVRDLLGAMKRGRLTVLQAESGAGKTSLLQAGIVPQIIREEDLAILIRSQFDNPTQTIKECFIRDLNLTPTLEKMRLVNFLRRVMGIIGHQTTLYLILDQFEEFFAKKTDDADRQDFIRDLAECLNDATLNVRWIIAITSDALGQLGKFEPDVPRPFSNVQSLYLFTQGEAEDVIEKTAQYHGLSFEEKLVKRILKDLGNQHDDPISPTQIQLVCSALYRDIKDKSTVFTHALYDEKNGAQGILHRHIDRVLRQELPLEERTVAYKVLEALVTSEKKRLMRARSDLEVDLLNRGIAPELLDATLNHLVGGRLLRRHGDDPHRIQYEIVHDYLLKEIEIDEGIIKVKQAEELLEDGLKAWRRNKNFLLTGEHLAFIESQFDQGALTLNEEKAEFLLLSAAVNNRAITRWVGVVSNERVQTIVSQSVGELNSQDLETRKKSKAIAWAMRKFLPASAYRKLYFEKVFRKAWVLVPILLILGLSFQPIKDWLSYAEVSVWEPISRFQEQTHANLQKVSLAVNLDNPDEVYVSDQTPGVLFRSTDGGDHWKKTTANGMEDAILQLSAMVENSLYGLTESAVWVSSDQGQNWEVTANINLSEAEQLTAISVNPRNADEGYVGANNGKLYYTSDHGKSWNEMLNGGYDGKRIQALATNGKVLIVATEKGLWVKSIETKSWKQLSLAGCQSGEDPADQVQALAIPSPRTDPPDHAVGFWAAISGLGICDSDTENLHATTLYYPNISSLSSVSATGDIALEKHAYVSAENGIVRYRTWFSHDLEWWKIKLQSLIRKGGKNGLLSQSVG